MIIFYHLFILEASLSLLQKKEEKKNPPFSNIILFEIFNNRYCIIWFLIFFVRVIQLYCNYKKPKKKKSKYTKAIS